MPPGFLAVPVKTIAWLANVPHDFFTPVEAIAPGGAGLFRRIRTPDNDGGVGFSMVAINAAAAAGNAQLLINENKLVTIAPGGRFSLDQVPFTQVDVIQAGAGAILVDVYYTGYTYDLLAEVAKNARG